MTPITLLRAKQEAMIVLSREGLVTPSEADRRGRTQERLYTDTRIRTLVSGTYSLRHLLFRCLTFARAYYSLARELRALEGCGARNWEGTEFMLEDYRFRRYTIESVAAQGACVCGEWLPVGAVAIVVVDATAGEPVHGGFCRQTCAEKWLAGALRRGEVSRA